MTPPWAPRDSVGQASSKHLAWRWILVILILLICTRAWSQTYQTSFAEVGVDRIRDAFKPDAVFQVDPPTGAVELNLPMGPGIGAGAIRFTPTLTGHLTENITFDVYGFRDDRNLLTTHPVFISILPGYLDLKTGPEADRDFSTYVSQYEIWNGVSGSFDGPLTEADKAIEAQALVRAFGYLAENVAVMRPFGLPGAACEFAKFTTSGDIFIALQSDAAPLFTLPIWLGDRSWWRHETPTKALLIRSGTAYEFTSEYREASGISAAQYGARVNRFRLTGIRDKFAGRIDIQYKGGPNCIDYQATWIRDHAPTGVAVTVADNCRGAINVDYSSASADRPAVDGYEITGSWAVPDVTHPIYLEYIGLNGKNDARLADFVPFITKGMYLRINKVRNKTTNQATSINWATYPFEVYNASYTIPESISCSSGYKAKFTWQTYLYQRNDARNGVWQGYFAKLQTNEKVKSNWMVGVTLVTETDGAGQERKTDYYRSVPRPQNPSGSNDWGGYPEFRTLITYPDGSLVWEDYWQPVQGSDGGPSRSLTEQYQMLAHLKHVVKERRFYGAGRHLYAVTDLNFGPEASAADKIIEYRDLDIRRDGIPGESVQASTIPAPSTIVTWDKVRGVRETVTLKAWQGSPAFAWAEIDRTVAQDGGGAQETRTDRSFSPLLQYGLFPRPSTEATTILADTNGGLAAGYSLPWTLPSLQTDFDPADPVLDRVASQTLAGASESIRTTYSYRSQAGLLADQVDSLQMSSPQLAGTVGIASYGYDPLGRRCSIRQQGAAWATGQSADGLGRVTSQTDANGFHTSFQWDGSSRLTDITPPMPMVPTHVEYAADQHGVIVTRGDPAHNRMEDRYDAFGQRVLTRRLVLGKKVGHKVYVYDPGGRKTFESVWLDGAGKDADGLSSKGLTGDRWVYDGLGRITDHTDPNGRVTHTDYAGLTRTVTVAYRTPEAMATSFRADALGRLIEVTDPLGQATRYGYEPGGKLASAVQGGQTRQWSYNGLGMLLASTQPESGTTLYRDLTVTGKPRRVVHQGDGSGPAQVLDYGYDELMRIRSVTSTDGIVAQTFDYDGAAAGGRPAEAFRGGNGRLTHCRDGRIEQFWAYQGLGGALSRLETQAWPSTGTPQTLIQDFDHDLFGNLDRAKAGHGEIRTDYDLQLSVPFHVKYNSATVALAGLDLAGNPDSLDFPATGLHAGFTYDLDQTRLRGLVYIQAGIVRHHWSMAYNPRGLLVSDAESSHPEYDPLGRLKLAAMPRLDPATGGPDLSRMVTQRYRYDSFGNQVVSLASPPDAGGNQNNFTFNEAEQALLAARNRLPATASGVPTGAEYDTQGNLTAIFKQAVSTQAQRLALSYDPLGRVTAVADEAEGTVQRYAYTADGLRTLIETSRQGAMVKAQINLYNPDRQLVSQYESAGDMGAVGQDLPWKRDFVYLGRREVAEVDARGLHLTLADRMGSPGTVMDASGTPEARKMFMPFGETLDLGGSFTPGKGFTNHEQTEVSGLIYMKGRFYLPQYHRFVSPDPGNAQHPEDPQSWNLYSYCENNPVMLIDPTGLEGVPWYLGGNSPMVDRALNGLYSAAVSYNLGFQMVGQPADALTAGINAFGHQNLPMLSNMGKSAEAGAGIMQLLLNHALEVPVGVMAGEVGGNLLGRAAGLFSKSIPTTTTLFRAVEPAELAGLNRNGGQFTNIPGIESKYFAFTARGASSEAKAMQGFGGPFTLVETQAPTNLFGPSNLFTDSTRFGPVPSVTFSSEQLQFLSPAMVKDTMRIP